MTTITVRPLGPNLIVGPATIIDPTGASFTVEDGQRVTLCRCGQSANKPFCDSTHKSIGWEHPEPIDVTRLPPGVTPS